MEKIDTEKERLQKLVKRLENRLTDHEKQTMSIEIASGDGHARYGDGQGVFVPSVREQHLEAEEEEHASLFARRDSADDSQLGFDVDHSWDNVQDDGQILNNGEEELPVDNLSDEGSDGDKGAGATGATSGAVGGNADQADAKESLSTRGLDSIDRADTGDLSEGAADGEGDSP
eukprot:scaffold1862_cov576-Prasinococcus_capsulatus_cf.AAC.13